MFQVRNLFRLNNVPRHHGNDHGTYITNNNAPSIYSVDISQPSSQGVQMMEEVGLVLLRNRWHRRSMFLGLFALSLGYGFDNVVRNQYQTQATNYFAAHSVMSSINVARAVAAMATYPIMAKLCNAVGRLEVLVLSVIFYAVGTTIEATASSIAAFAIGDVIYQIGFTTMLLLVEIIIADITELKTRLFWTTVPIWHTIGTAWLGGIVNQEVHELDETTNEKWKVGYGMWAAAVPTLSLPLVYSLGRAYHLVPNDRLNGWMSVWSMCKQGFSDLRNPRALNTLETLEKARLLFLDFLIVPGLALFLVSLTLIGGGSSVIEQKSRWKTKEVLAPLITGLVCTIMWVTWQIRRGANALLPITVLRDRAVWTSFGVACMLNFCFRMQADFLSTVLRVSFARSVSTTTMIIGLFSFCSVVVATALGQLVYRISYRKPLWFIINTGILLYTIAFVILVNYRSGPENSAGIIGGQVLLGIGGGCITYPTQVVLQSATRHENLAIAQGLFMAMFSVGSAMGSAASGAVWTDMLPPALRRHLRSPFDNEATVDEIYGSPLNFTERYAIGESLRDDMVDSYDDVQKILTAIGTGFCGLLLFFGLFSRNPELRDKQTASTVEEREIRLGLRQEWREKLQEVVGRFWEIPDSRS